VHGVLRHLEAAGFDGAPRVLGFDENGREILTWIDGRSAQRPWPTALRTDEGLAALAALLRRAHDVLATYRPPPGAQWWIGSRELRDGEIVCHGDVGPWNTIWRDAVPVAFIDWDACEPAPPIRDVAELAFFAVPMRDDDHCRDCGFTDPPDRRQRLGVVCDAYGRYGPGELIEAAVRNWELDIRRIETLAPLGLEPWAGFAARRIPDEGRAFVDYLRRNTSTLA
jgi:hypothetical protein